MTDSFKIGVAGLGTVGCGVIDILQTHAENLAHKAGCPIEIIAVNARSKEKERPVDLSSYEWCDDPLDLAKHSQIDCILELIGGEEGVAKDLIETALNNKKHVITANKALLAYHGYELAQLAEQNNAALAYEAAVAGGIPVIKALREGFVGNEIKALSGILNGTCNYILTEMKETGRDFEDVLQEAQAKGYAETPPDLDIDGDDAAHKLCLLTALAFGVRPDFKALSVEGIRSVSSDDIRYADELGYKIKLLGTARKVGGQILQVMEPCLVPMSLPIAQVDDVFNAVNIEGDFVDTSLLVGRGAGAGPTASAVLSDIIDVARRDIRPVFGIPTSELRAAEWMKPDALESRFYVCLNVIDTDEILTDIEDILKEHQIAIDFVIKKEGDSEQQASLVIITREGLKEQLKQAFEKIQSLSSVTGDPHILRIEDL